MNHLDTSWCPVCSRQILPKRYLVPVTQQAANTTPIPAPPPSSPIESTTETSPTQQPAARQTRRTGTIRQKVGGGLVRGTGRVKPNGALKRSDSKPQPAAPLPPQLTQAIAAPVKHRTVIDQSPTPLYCSDECRLADLNSMYGGLSLDYNPDRHPRDSPPLPPVPHNSLSTLSGLGDESDSSSSPSTSPESQGHTLATERNPFTTDSPVMTPSVAALARIYGFPPLPPRPAVLEEPPKSTVEFDNDYQSGVMMAARRIKENLCSQAESKTVRAYGQPAKERKPIPGWTDGSDSWRSTVYSLTSPTAPVSSTSLSSRDERPAAYGSFIASPHRSTGVYSTIGENNTPVASTTSASSSRLSAAARANTSDDLYSKYPLAFSRRSDSRSSLPGSAPQAQSFPVHARRREQSILKPGAEGKLLVPDVKLKASSAGSYYSNDGASVSSWRSGSTRSHARSPLSRHGSEVSVESGSDLLDAVPEHQLPSSLPATKRPTNETRSWSYDNMTTYPVMPMPPRKEIRYERRVVDGVTTVVETEIEVQPQRKRLFLFPGKERR
ncbi:hypothetical protein BC834DRAFT_841564 [Gloeopeniophorella convolvens]|nr:hypothetical protein BC834DRAFT_841564 [Gloeopeniophorella convolvens]